jgi:hypothetical protein
MKKVFTLFLVVLAATFITQATDNASFNWFLAGGGATGADRSADVVTDVSGNIFVANYFLSSATFNGVTLTGSPKGSGASFDNSLFLSKISPAKTTLWTISSNVGVVTPTALSTTPSGDLIVTGTIRAVVGGATTNANIIDAAGTVTTFTGLNTSSSYVQSFVAKFNANGIIQWVNEFDSGTAKDKAVTTNGLAVDASGNVYVVATYTSSVVLTAATPVTLTSTNTTQASFIAKLSGATGSVVWNKTSSGAIASETISSLVYGDDGYLYAAGIYRNATTPITVTIGDKSFTPSAGYDLTLIRLDTDGNITYIQNRSNASDTRVKDLAVKSGKVFIAGSFRGDGGGIVISGGTALTSTAAYLNGFTLAFNSTNGADLWQKIVYSPGITDTDGIIVGSDGRLYAFGAYANKTGSATAADVDFGNSKTIANTTAGNTSADIFLVSYNVSNGTTLEVHAVGTSATYETANSLATFGNNLYLLGTTNGAPLTFENAATYTTLGAYDFFLTAYTVSNQINGIDPTEKEKSLSVYVDNVNRQLVVNNADNVKLATLFDATGRSLKTLTNCNTVLTISSQEITSGIYILKLITKNGNIISQRLIIQ